MNNKRHEFAFFVETLSRLVEDKQGRVTISDPTIVHRVTHVVRLQLGEAVILFDDTWHARAQLIEYAKSAAVFKLESAQKNTELLPRVTLLLPLLKREALDEVVYAARELGISSIAFVSAEKSSRHTVSASEKERLTRISIAAAEQSKNFFPCHFIGLEKTPSLVEYVQEQSKHSAFIQGCKWYADPSGMRWQEAASSCAQSSEIFLCLGPEGDLSDREKTVLKDSGFVFCQLGPTILRAQQAAIIFMGLVRTTLSKD